MASSSTTADRRAICLIVLALIAVLVSAPGPATAEDTVVIAYLQRDGDPYYESHRSYPGLILLDRHPSLDGARMAIQESRIVGRSLGVSFKLAEIALGAEESAADAISRLTAERGIGLFILDLPLADVANAGARLADRDLILFNPRHPDNGLRGESCSPVLFHTYPSQAMLMDALAQYLAKKAWTDVLVLAGNSNADKAVADAFADAARKFRLSAGDVRRFVISNDPRQRDQTNIPILTGRASYDVVFVADESRELGRYVAYQSYLPRPVVGTEGLVADAWHWTWERHGGPQLSQRFERRVGRPMESRDWAAWAAVKAVIEAVARTKSTKTAALKGFLTSNDFILDAYKGTPASFRPWDHQLRQPILLHTHNAVIERAPIEGFLHEKNTLDTLGVDEANSECHFR